MWHWKFSAQLKMTTALFCYTTLCNGHSYPDDLQATWCPHLPVSISPDPPTPARYYSGAKRRGLTAQRSASRRRRSASALIWTSKTKPAKNPKIQPCPLKTQNNTTLEPNGNGYYEISLSMNMCRAGRCRASFKHGWQSRITLLNFCPVIQQLLTLTSEVVQYNQGEYLLVESDCAFSRIWFLQDQLESPQDGVNYSSNPIWKDIQLSSEKLKPRQHIWSKSRLPFPELHRLVISSHYTRWLSSLDLSDAVLIPNSKSAKGLFHHRILCNKESASVLLKEN